MSLIESKDILFIINPNSGSKKAENVIEEIKTIDSNISTVITRNLQELKATFKQDIDKFKVFIAVGGDGTVNEVMKYLYGREDKIFGILPSGSGNGFAREMGFNGSVQSLISAAIKGSFKTIDVLSINNEKCINAAGLGFDSLVAHKFQHSKKRGLANYIYLSAKILFSFKPFDATIIISDGEVIRDSFQMITIANTRQFGNNALIAPHANPSDGVFELVLVKPFPIYLYPLFLYNLFSGKLKNSKYLNYLSIQNSVEIESNFNKLHIDGEPKFFSEKLYIKMLDKKINVINTD